MSSYKSPTRPTIDKSSVISERVRPQRANPAACPLFIYLFIYTWEVLVVLFKTTFFFCSGRSSRGLTISHIRVYRPLYAIVSVIVLIPHWLEGRIAYIHPSRVR